MLIWRWFFIRSNNIHFIGQLVFSNLRLLKNFRKCYIKILSSFCGNNYKIISEDTCILSSALVLFQLTDRWGTILPHNSLRRSWLSLTSWVDRVWLWTTSSNRALCWSHWRTPSNPGTPQVQEESIWVMRTLWL